MGLFSLSSQIDTKSVRINSYIKYITECWLNCIPILATSFDKGIACYETTACNNV